MLTHVQCSMHVLSGVRSTDAARDEEMQGTNVDALVFNTPIFFVLGMKENRAP